jgi:hypothetical protein
LKKDNPNPRLYIAIKTKIDQLPLPEELLVKKRVKKEFEKKDIMIAKLVIIKNELASIPSDEFKQLTDLPQNEKSFDLIIENIIEALKKAKIEIEKKREKCDFEKNMNKLKSKFKDY